MSQPLRAPDRLDLAPAFTPAAIAALAARTAGMATDALLADLIAQLRGRVAVVSSFGIESAVLLHLVARIDRCVPVIFINTQKMFGETLAYRDSLVELLGLTDLRVVRPDPHAIAARDGKSLRWAHDPDGCCHLRKVEPLARALAPFDAWISGRKAFQAERSDLPRLEPDGGRLKINPLADWDRRAIDAHFAAHQLPRHPLEADGFASIGCVPCTSRVQPGEDPRAGRWRHWDKTECGIHNQPAF